MTARPPAPHTLALAAAAALALPGAVVAAGLESAPVPAGVDAGSASSGLAREAGGDLDEHVGECLELHHVVMDDAPAMPLGPEDDMAGHMTGMLGGMTR